MNGLFGADGVFGPKGPFGPDGPFGPTGPFAGGGFDVDAAADAGAHHGRMHRRGPGRRRRMFGQGELRLAMLKLLADEPRHGYELIKAIEELTGGDYAPSPGAVYPTLALLADEGAIAEQDDEGPRNSYAATAQGRDELTERSDEVEALFERLSAMGETRHSAPNLQVRRAMENLRNALRTHRHRGTLESKLVEDIVDLIDDTAKRIERL